MGKHWHCPEVDISIGALLWLALLLLAVPLPWLTAAVTAAAFHELCHCLIIWILGGTVCKISVGGGGTAIEMANLSTGKELLAAMAGPAGSFLLLLLAVRSPRLALCGLVQGLFNLLPVYPMDGGRILFCGLTLAFPLESAERVCIWVENATFFLLLTCSIAQNFLYPAGLLPFFFFLGMTIKAKRRKNPCKEWV